MRLVFASTVLVLSMAACGGSATDEVDFIRINRGVITAGLVEMQVYNSEANQTQNVDIDANEDFTELFLVIDEGSFITVSSSPTGLSFVSADCTAKADSYEEGPEVTFINISGNVAASCSTGWAP